MSGSRNATKETLQNNSTRDKGPSNYELTKSFGGYHNFVRSYDLKPGQEDEASGILSAFREADEYQSSEAESESCSGYGSGSESEGSRSARDPDRASNTDEEADTRPTGAASPSSSRGSIASNSVSSMSHDSQLCEDSDDETLSEEHDCVFSHDGDDVWQGFDSDSYSSEGVCIEESEGDYHSDFDDSEEGDAGSDCSDLSGSDGGVDDSD
jgi:hypothetical protein